MEIIVWILFFLICAYMGVSYYKEKQKTPSNRKSLITQAKNKPTQNGSIRYSKPIRKELPPDRFHEDFVPKYSYQTQQQTTPPPKPPQPAPPPNWREDSWVYLEQLERANRIEVTETPANFSNTDIDHDDTDQHNQTTVILTLNKSGKEVSEFPYSSLLSAQGAARSLAETVGEPVDIYVKDMDEINGLIKYIQVKQSPSP